MVFLLSVSISVLAKFSLIFQSQGLSFSCLDKLTHLYLLLMHKLSQA